MSDGPEWFAPKRYGYGAGWPISWQGWALTIGMLVIVIALSLAFRDDKLRLLAGAAPFLIAFTVICARTTRGGWRWRWGKDD
jgi:hypothetical protein